MFHHVRTPWQVSRAYSKHGWPGCCFSQEATVLRLPWRQPAIHRQIAISQRGDDSTLGIRSRLRTTTTTTTTTTTVSRGRWYATGHFKRLLLHASVPLSAHHWPDTWYTGMQINGIERTRLKNIQYACDTRQTTTRATSHCLRSLITTACAFTSHRLDGRVASGERLPFAREAVLVFSDVLPRRDSNSNMHANTNTQSHPS